MGRNEQIVALRQEGVGPREIARQLELSPNVVAGVLRRAGLAAQDPKAGGWGGGYSPEIKAMAIRFIDDIGITRSARHFGVSLPTLHRWRKDALIAQLLAERPHGVSAVLRATGR